MSFYFAKVFTANVTGTRVVDAACERCQTGFHYHLVRQGTGTGSAPYYLFQGAAERRAQAAAADDLAKRLAREREPVPCPQCQWVNQRTIDAHRKRLHRWLTSVAWTGAIALFIVIILSRASQSRQIRDEEWLPLLAVAGGVAATILVVCFVAQRKLRRRFDPNRDFPNPPTLPIGTPVGWVDGDAPTLAMSGTTPVAAAANGVGDDDRVVIFHMGTLALPDACCECLEPATQTYKPPFEVGGERTRELAMPTCAACAARLRRRWWQVAGVTTLAVVWVAMTLYYLMPNDPQGSRAGAIAVASVVAVVGLPIALAVVPAWRVRPYRFKVVDASRDLASVRFKNADYAALSRAAMEAQ